MDERELIYAPRSQRDLLGLEKNDSMLMLEDLEVLRTPPWPPGKVKKLRGHEFWEIKTGDFRTIFWPQGKRVIVLRVVNRRDLERTLGRIDVRSLVEWLRARGASRPPLKRRSSSPKPRRPRR